MGPRPLIDSSLSSETTHIDFLDFLDFYDANRRARDREIARSRNRDRGERRKEEKRSHRKPRARARRGGADGEGTPRSPPSRAFDRHSTTPTRRVPGPRPNANERANDAERFVRTDHAYARARRRSHRARAGGLYDRPSLADASAAGSLSFGSRRRVRECTVGHRRGCVLFASSRRSGSRTDRPCASVRPASGAFCPMEGFSARTREGVVVFTF